MEAVELDVGWARIALLPSAPYSADGASPSCVLGVTLERQQGVHAVAGGARRDFDAWPGEFALAAPGVPVFSESEQGGEYLLLQADAAVAPAVTGAPRRVFSGQRRAVILARSLRRLLLQHQQDVLPDAQAGVQGGAAMDRHEVAEQAALLLAHGAALLDGAPRPSGEYGGDRAAHAHVLARIEDELASSLPLEQLAATAGMPLLRFLLSFAFATGMTPHAWITERRLQRARRMLRSSTAPLAEIAAACGFTHQSHLGALLKRETAHTPSRYRRG